MLLWSNEKYRTPFEGRCIESEDSVQPQNLEFERRI